MNAAPRLVLQTSVELSESPVWAASEQSLYWADATGPRLNRLDVVSGANTAWPLVDGLGSFALCEGGGVIAALHSGFAFLEPDKGRVTWICRPFPLGDAFFLNDGRCDRSGRFFWSGSVDKTKVEAGGGLYRLDENGDCRRMADGVVASNGIAFSPDNRLLYYADSFARTIWRFDHDPASGVIHNRTVFATVPEGEGLPDGAAVDAQGHYWSARAFGGRLVRYRPDGSIERTIHLPFRNPTMVAFGGRDLRTLYITTTRRRLSEADADKEKAGSLFAMDVDVQGLSEPSFRKRPTNPPQGDGQF